MAQEDKLKALEAAISKIEKDFGKGAVMKLGDSKANMNVETIPTGCLSLDIALGLGGIPKGRIIEVYTRVQRKDYRGVTYGCAGAEAGRHRRFY